MSNKLYVGNLPYETTESDLQTLFAGAGDVSTVNIVRDRATGQARGFAFVEMSDVEGATRAIEMNADRFVENESRENEGFEIRQPDHRG